MTHKIFTALVCVSLVTLLAACGTPNDGYYDANGNFVPNNPYNSANHTHAPLPSGTHDDRADNADYNDNHHYTRRGYYDYNGYYIARDSGLTVPQDMFPSRGMCRVWFTDRPVENQPDVESCTDIKSRVPAGAYVIYGG